MILAIAENINIMSKNIGQAMKMRDPGPIQAMAQQLAAAGAQYLDVNIGPAKKDGPELMRWLVETIHAVVDLPLCLDTTNAEAMEAGLEAHRKGGRPIVNSVSCQSDRIDVGLTLVKRYNALMVGLLWGNDGMPRDANERAALAVDLVYRAQETGIACEDIFIDPIVTPIKGEINQVRACMECMAMLQDIAPGCRSIVGISNVSNGVPHPLRPFLNRTYLAMLAYYGLASAIVDGFDQEIMALCRDERNEICSLIRSYLHGETPAQQTLSDRLRPYAKTFEVLSGATLYSDSWLEV
ncbi:MAG: dihydropteroate synthase [Desulfobacterota bacterium]|nr:dihydropteroate synthase [Thermodesulfobacteriota bacterium]